MKTRMTWKWIILLVALVVLASACSGPAVQVQPEKTEVQGSAAATQAQDSGQTAASQPDIETLTPNAKGYVLYNRETGMFLGFAMDHSPLFEAPAPGLQYPSPDTVDLVDGAVYYLQEVDRQMFRTSSAGVEKVSVPPENLQAFAVSPDEQWIAWSATDWSREPIESQLWIAGLDSARSLIEPRMVASYNSAQSDIFNLIPLQWTDSGQLIFDRFVSGLGGYILFGGRNSLYSYDPLSGQIATIIPAEEKHGICLDSYRLDLDQAVFNCDASGPGIKIRSLVDFTEIKFAEVPGYPVAGSAFLSPSGQWLAYAAARRNPDDEAGLVLLVPSDASSKPVILAQATGNRYASVAGWLDDETILFSINQWPEVTLWTVKIDGGTPQQVHNGSFFQGWMR